MLANGQMDAAEVLLELERLRALKARYFRYVDGKAWDEWGELFEPDVVTEFPDEPPGFVFRGREEFVGAIRVALGPALTIHHGHTPELELTAPDAASGIWVMQDWLRWPQGGGPDGISNLDGWGHYHETYVKSDAGWRIKSLRLTRVHVIRT